MRDLQKLEGSTMSEELGGEEGGKGTPLPKPSEVFEAISLLLGVAIHYPEMYQYETKSEERAPNCQDGDLRDWARADEGDFTDSFKEGMA